MIDSARLTARQSPESAPFGEVGAPHCRCGASVNPEHPDRCKGGHVLPGNTTAVVTGSRSAAFWAEHHQARRELAEAVIVDAGHQHADAPRTLEIAADGLAQAVLVRDAAYQHLVAAGGPMTSSGRTRRVFMVWLQSADRVDKGVRLVGLKKAPKKVETLASVMAAPADSAP